MRSIDGRSVSKAAGLGQLIKHQLELLQSIIAFEHQGNVVAPQSFSLGRGDDPVQDSATAASGSATDRHRIRRDTPAMYREAEPRLPMIGHMLSYIGRACRFEQAGGSVRVDGFRLTNLKRWARYDCPSLLDNINLETVTSSCSSDCEFCFLKGWGPAPLARRFCTLDEARTRRKFYSTANRRGLPVPSCTPGEPLLNPHTLAFLRMAREADPERVFTLTTNGDLLDERTIVELARLRPISVVVSLNVVDREKRRQIVRTRRPDAAVEAIPLLRTHGIQFIGSIVASHLFDLASIEQTVRYLDRHDALMVRLLLPGYTRFHAPEQTSDPYGQTAGEPTATCGRDAWWDRLVELAQRLRGEVAAPLFLQPNLYWDRHITPRIDGIYGGSPAERAGLRRDDWIVDVDGTPISTKADVLDVFSSRDRTNRPMHRRVTVRRGGSLHTVELDGTAGPDDDLYPYKPRGYPLGEGFPDARCLGMHIPEGFRIEQLVFLKQCIAKHPGARHALLFTTLLMKEHFLQAMRLAGQLPECSLGDVELRLTVAEHSYWGGNIVVGDLHVVQDYVDHLERLRRIGYCPDLVLIPSSFLNAWQLDLTGRTFQDIERQTGIPVELIPTKRIMW